MGSKRPSGPPEVPAAAVQVDSPVFRFHDEHRHRASTDGAGATAYAVGNSGQWAADEQERFLQALEKHGCGQSTNVAAAWRAIATAVGTRSLQDVKAHAHRYFLQLQMVNSQRRKEHLLMQQVDTRWTLHEDELLEAELARHASSGAVCFPWDQLARQLPGKSPKDVRERFQKLCYDVARIEAGQHIMMHLGRAPPTKSAIPPDADTTDQPIDCVVPLTPSETRLLLTALEQVSVPSHTLPDVLAAVASAVAALACSKNRVPPTRPTPMFSLDDACRTLQHTIDLDTLDPRRVLELIVSELGLLPHHNLRKQHREYAPSHVPFRSVAATTGFTFSQSHSSSFETSGLSTPTKPGAAEPSVCTPQPSLVSLCLKKEETRSAEELLNLRTSPMHSEGFSNTLRQQLATPRFTADLDTSSALSFTPHGTMSFSFPPIAASSSYPAEFMGFDNGRGAPGTPRQMSQFRM